MAKPISDNRLVKILKDQGLDIKEFRSWRSHSRNHKGAWGPINGVMVHHTVTKGESSTADILYDGHSSLPGPLCHFGIMKSGKVYLISNGRANHAGLGDDNVLDAVIDERGLPRDNEANTDGNSRFYGLECENLGNGRDPWPEKQLLAIEKVCAAICLEYGWNARSVIGHLEWQPGKIDPRGFSMNHMRDRVQRRIDAIKRGDKDPAPKPSKPKPSGDTYKVDKGDTLWGISHETGVSIGDLKDWNNLKSDEIFPGDVLKIKKPEPDKKVDPVEKKSKTYKEVWETDAARPPKGHETDRNPTWWPMSLLRYACEQLDEISKRLDALEKKL